jgi:hypothetical protein
MDGFCQQMFLDGQCFLLATLRIGNVWIGDLLGGNVFELAISLD